MVCMYSVQMIISVIPSIDLLHPLPPPPSSPCSPPSLPPPPSLTCCTRGHLAQRWVPDCQCELTVGSAMSTWSSGHLHHRMLSVPVWPSTRSLLQVCAHVVGVSVGGATSAGACRQKCGRPTRLGQVCIAAVVVTLLREPHLKQVAVGGQR